ncbi:sigma-54 specific transcriptional regulator, flagellar regulatory protein A [Thalassococcus halodurans]|uniref:Nif-specific regulatory protein n=1 Tax=Thalassococcus halodurans TaxID=373675 RepID=A0A1H5S5U9_9RHOB|nr:sigma-54 dependent transcriptional regulator [Thalassococcus halodurans]SEF45187.1 sigma-54 specific transcriptional regulator, flagellar regulatory protein A [Thalassococcus halodurans]
MTTHWTPGSQDIETMSDPRMDSMIVGQTPVVVSMKNVISLVAPSDAAVMVQGPTGAGKELVAQALHMLSGRKGPLVAVNCAAIPADLLESELFGHEKGAFTGATERRIGRVEQADGGTLFLDEIGEMPLALQAKLLRLLETQKIQRIGGRSEIDVNFRLVTATHRRITDEVAEGRFREDLFFRINVFPVTVPSLAERAADIPLILTAMDMRMKAQRPGMKTPIFSSCAMRALLDHSWPGNVRELRNVFERAAVLFSGQTVTAEHVRAVLLTPDMNGSTDGGTGAIVDQPAVTDLREAIEAEGSINMRRYLLEIEAGLIEMALELNDGCVAHAARALRIKRTTLIEKMKKLSINRLAA